VDTLVGLSCHFGIHGHDFESFRSFFYSVSGFICVYFSFFHNGISCEKVWVMRLNFIR
jgi:hypothetical protein